MTRADDDAAQAFAERRMRSDDPLFLATLRFEARAAQRVLDEINVRGMVYAHRLDVEAGRGAIARVVAALEGTPATPMDSAYVLMLARETRRARKALDAVSLKGMPQPRIDAIHQGRQAIRHVLEMLSRFAPGDSPAGSRPPGAVRGDHAR